MNYYGILFWDCQAYTQKHGWLVTIRNIDFSPPLCASNWGHGLKVTRNINLSIDIFNVNKLIAFVININYWVPSPTCIKPDRDGVEGQGLPVNAVQGVGLVDHGRPPVPGLGQGRLVTRVTTLIAHCGAQQSQVRTLPEWCQLGSICLGLLVVDGLSQLRIFN